MTTTIETSKYLQQHYDKLFQDGVLINLNISMWGMQAKLSTEDLGLKEVPAVFQLGKKFLLDPKVVHAFKKIESSARHYLYGNSHDFSLARLHFVPRTRIVEVLAKLTEFKMEFDLAVLSLVEKYDEYQENLFSAYPELKEKMLPYYPVKAQLPSKFSFSFTPMVISMPKEMGVLDLKTEIDRANINESIKAQLRAQQEEQMAAELGRVKTFVTDISQSLRQRILEHCSLVVDKIKRKELVTRTNIQTLIKQATDFKDLNILGDPQVETKLADLLKTLNEGSEFRQGSTSLAVLEQQLDGVLNEASKITDFSATAGNYFRNMEIE